MRESSETSTVPESIGSDPTYIRLCQVVDPDFEIRSMSDGELRDLARVMNRSRALRGIPGQIRGMVILETSRRWIQEKGQKL